MSIIYSPGDKVYVPQPGKPSVPGVVKQVDLSANGQVVTVQDTWGTVHTRLGRDLRLRMDMVVPGDEEDEDQDDESIIAAWDDDVETVVEAIRDGYLDKHLRDIAKAAIDRYTEVRGTDLIKKSDNGGSKPAAPAATTVTATNMLSMHSVQPDQLGDVNILGRRYRKTQLMGRTIVIQPESKWSDGEYDGKRVVISGIGKKMAKVDWVDPPPVGSGMERRIKKQMPTFVPFSVLEPYLAV